MPVRNEIIFFQDSSSYIYTPVGGARESIRMQPMVLKVL